jgi:hypothetical protein
VHNDVHRKGQLTSSCCMLRPLDCITEIDCEGFAVFVARIMRVVGSQRATQSSEVREKRLSEEAAVRHIQLCSQGYHIFLQPLS